MRLLILLTIIFTTYSQNLSKSSQIKPSGKVEIKLYVFDTGLLTTQNISLMFPAMEKKKKELTDPSYLIVHPKGTLFWDAGMNDSISQFPKGLDIWGGGWNVKVKRTLIDQLNEININPKNINYTAFSHFHGDHTGNATYFINSTLLMQKSAVKLAFSDKAITKGFSPNDYAQFRTKKILLDGDYDVFGDKSVIILSTPGHSVGHQMLYVDLPNQGPILLSGDLYIIAEQRQNFWVPQFNINKVETIHSFSKIEKFIKQTKSKLWIQHDYDQFKTMKKSPLFYD